MTPLQRISSIRSIGAFNLELIAEKNLQSYLVQEGLVVSEELDSVRSKTNAKRLQAKMSGSTVEPLFGAGVRPRI